MEQKVDLDALEAALGKATPGPWKWSINDKRVQVAAVRHAAQVCSVWNTSAHPASAVADAIVYAHNALPALIAELRELRARTTPEVIGQKHQNRRLWLVCVPEFDGWQEAKWEPTSELWVNDYGGPIFGTPTHALPMPGQPEGV